MPAARPASHAVAGQQVPPHIAQFVDDFYRVTDEEDPKAYANMYTKDGSLFVVASRKGREEIEAGCRASYTQRDNSVHRYHHIMVTQPDRELFVTGDIDFDRRVDGEKIRNVPWVARITLREEEGSLKIEDYYVWVVSDGKPS